MFAFLPPLTALVRRPFQTPLRQPVSRTPFVGRALLAAVVIATPLSTVRSEPATMSLADLHSLKDIDGNPVASDVFAGKVVFAMNVASACGYTQSGYDLFKKLTDKYSAEDFVAVAIPCNSFGFQESGSPEQIKSFALARANKLLIMERSDVNGAKQHPIVQLAKSKFPARIQWNFDGRYVFDRTGHPIARFGNSASDAEIEAAIDSAL